MLISCIYIFKFLIKIDVIKTISSMTLIQNWIIPQLVQTATALWKVIDLFLHKLARAYLRVLIVISLLFILKILHGNFCNFLKEKENSVLCNYLFFIFDSIAFIFLHSCFYVFFFILNVNCFTYESLYFNYCLNLKLWWSIVKIFPFFLGIWRI